jgi:glycosyltransferase involved in cell wall biosynthesis
VRQPLEPGVSPTVDIGMPAYKRPQFIAEAIESVLAQSHTDWRLFVSENGPGGGEVEAAVRPYTADPRVTFSPTGENRGPAANWTRVVQAGDAPYVSVIQDDDKWEPGFLARRVAFLEQHPECAFVFSGERKMDQHGREVAIERTRALPPKDISEVLPQGVYQPREFITAMYRNKLGGIHTPAICSVGVMSRRASLASVGATFDANYPFLYWDVELYMRMALRYPTGFLAVRDGIQRLHHPSLTSESNFDGEHWLRFHAYHSAWFRRELPGLKLPPEFDEIVAQVYVMAALDAGERGERRKVVRYIGGALRRSPGTLKNPRLALAGASALLGRRGGELLARARAERQRRSEILAYETSADHAYPQ